MPASGAASRMFKNLFEFLSADYDQPTTKFEQAFFDGIKNFAFYDDLNVACQRISGKDIPGLMEEGNYKAVVSALLETAGLNYGALPKGLLKFHKYPEGSRTPMEEHLAEGALYAAGKSGKVNVHFTVSTEHRELFKKLVTEKVDDFAKRYGVDYYITFSEQKPSTDTIAADMDNQPFRDNGKLLFRPGGHGALIENLNDLDADIIFIKNIDNVVPDRLKADTVTYKKLIAGVLVTLQKQVFEYLTLLDSGKYTHDQMMEMLQFLQKKLFCKNPETKDLEDSVLAIYLKNKFNRPMRVCGMVKNVGEPGGGPFLAYNSDGTISLQILESSQIDMDDPEKKEMFEKASMELQEAFPHKILRHICNSAGIERFPGAQFDMVRLGIGLYGVNPIDNSIMNNVSTLKTTILQIRDVPEEDTVGYSRKGHLTRPSRIAALPIGYADGLNRHLGNGHAYCLVNGQRAAYVGNICMDVCMIDVTDIDCREGDKAVIFGDDLPITTLSDKLGTIPYEVLTSISNRVKRVYYQD